MKLFFLTFLIFPFIEIFLLIKAGENIGAWPTIGLIVFTAFVGAIIFKSQGFLTWRRVQNALSEGRIPAIELLEGVVILVCGALLLAPGFITDTVGIICLLPPIRRSIVRFALHRMRVLHYVEQDPFETIRQAQYSYQRRSSMHSDYIDGEYRRDD